MNRPVSSLSLAVLLAGSALVWTACSTANGSTNEPASATPAAVSVTASAALEQPIARFIRATGSLTAEEQADVAAEIRARVISTPIERGTPVREGDELVRLSSAEAAAQAAEAEANAAQIEARLGLTAGSPFDVNAVPEVRTARASYDLAESEFGRIRALLDQRVVSQSEFDQRRTQMEAARQQYEGARNAAAQQFQALQAARARVTLARKALADTVVRAPFNGLVSERLVSVGDYVTSGTTVATIVRIDPLRVRLTVPEQFVAAVGIGQAVSFEVDAYAGRRFEGRIRYVSPALESNQRALTVEAVVPNPGRELKPGLFATARIELAAPTPGIVVPLEAVVTNAGTSRVYVLTGNRAEERLVTLGQTVGGHVEVTGGLKAGERVATTGTAQLRDGATVQF
jgi:multidrug efflux pump subunit AcrA (membrane-fusion protein)